MSNIKPGERFFSGRPDNACVVVVTSVDTDVVRFVTVGWLVGSPSDPLRLDPAETLVKCRLDRRTFEATHFSTLEKLTAMAGALGGTVSKR
jgi:hypothetical protein